MAPTVAVESTLPVGGELRNILSIDNPDFAGGEFRQSSAAADRGGNAGATSIPQADVARNHHALEQSAQGFYQVLDFDPFHL